MNNINQAWFVIKHHFSTFLKESNGLPKSISLKFVVLRFLFLLQRKVPKIIRVLGLLALISYMIVILFTWISANMQGYESFSAGEPVLSIKYPEWALGFLGIFVAIDYLLKELNNYSGHEENHKTIYVLEFKE